MTVEGASLRKPRNKPVYVKSVVLAMNLQNEGGYWFRYLDGCHNVHIYKVRSVS